MEKTYEITEKLLISLLNYLAVKPFAEVSVLINSLQALKVKEEEEPKDSKNLN